MSEDKKLNKSNENNEEIINQQDTNETEVIEESNQIQELNGNEDFEITEEDLSFLNEEEQEQEQENKVEEKPKSKKKILPVVAGVAVAVLCLGLGYNAGKDAGRALPATHKKYSDSKVVATVGESEITEGDLRAKMEPVFYLNAKVEMTEEEIKASEDSMIDYMTTTEVLYLEGKEEKVEASEEEVENQYVSLMGSITQTFGMTEEEFTKEFDITKEEIKAELEKELIASKYMQLASEVSDTEAKNYYDQNKDEFLNVRASHILILNTDENGEPLSEEGLAEAKAEAEDILKRAQSGEDFEALAKEYSQDGSAANGGDLDFFTKGQMVEPFENAAFALEVGQISEEVVETQFGYHIIKKTDEKQEELETVQEQLKYNLAYEKQDLLITDLVEKYNVEVKEI